MRVYLNGKYEDVPDNCTIEELLKSKNIRNRISIWINGKQVLLKDYSVKRIRPNDEVKIIRILGGG